MNLDAVRRARHLALRSLGTRGWTAIAVFAVASALEWIGAAGLRSDMAERRAVHEQQRKAVHRLAQADPAMAADRDLSGFYARLPSITALPRQLKQIYELADKHALALERGEYRLQREGAGAIAGYQITLPVRGSYRQIRQFADDALNADVHLALDEIRFNRDQIGTASLEATLQFTLFVGGR